MNAWHVGHADWKFPRPSFHTVDGYRPRLVVIGDSFWWLAVDLISENRLAAKSEFFYYFNDPDRTGDKRVEGQPRGLPRGMSWDYVFSAEAVIVEANEAGLGDLGHGFVEAAGEALIAAPDSHAAGPTPVR